jgi:hypothetical protein
VDMMISKPYPLRTALIGLSSSAATSWASAAHLPALLSETGRSKFAIKALLNSSVEAAKSAVEHYKLPADTKTYGSPEDLAADPDIDLVICNTRVDKHYEVIIPSIRAGKDVFVEWPIASKRSHIEEIINTAQQSGSRVAVGLQRRWNPIVSKARQLVKDEKLGKLLNAEARLFGATNDREILPASLKYFLQKEIGGNVITIGVAHSQCEDDANTSCALTHHSARHSTLRHRRRRPSNTASQDANPASRDPHPRPFDQRHHRDSQVRCAGLPLLARTSSAICPRRIRRNTILYFPARPAIPRCTSGDVDAQLSAR